MDKFWQLEIASYLKRIRRMALQPAVSPWVRSTEIPIRIFFITVVPIQVGRALKVTKYRFLDRGAGLLTGVRSKNTHCLESMNFFGSSMARARQPKHFADRFSGGVVKGDDVYLYLVPSPHKDLTAEDYRKGFEIGMLLNVNGSKLAKDDAEHLPIDWNLAPSRQYVRIEEITRVLDHYQKIHGRVHDREFI